MKAAARRVRTGPDGAGFFGRVSGNEHRGRAAPAADESCFMSTAMALFSRYTHQAHVRRGLVLALLAAIVLASTAPAADLRVGTAAVEINPPLGTPLAGYYHERGCQGALDDLHAKAAVLDDGTSRVAFVVCDLLGLPEAVVAAVRSRIEAKTGIPGTNVLLAATHTHTGPVLARGSARETPNSPGGQLSRAYTETLPDRIAEAVTLAHGRLAPTRVSRGRELEPRLSFNRRFWMKDGTVGWNPGKLNPNIIRPAGPIDPEVAVVYFQSPTNQPQLTFVNFAMHPDTTGGIRVSADYPGALARCLATWRGAEMMTLFANGACGNLNHLNVQWAERQQGPGEANRLGTILAGAVFKACMALEPVRETRLRMRSTRVELPLPRVTDAEVEAAQAIVAQGAKAKFMDQVQAYKAIDVRQRRGEAVSAEVQVIALGDDIAWVALPGEIFVELGLSIKAASPFRLTQIVELANGSVGYVPNRPAYAEGNYEVVSTRCGEGSGELLVTTALRLLGELRDAR